MVGRIILTSISEGFKTVIRSWMALRAGRRDAKRGVRVFKQTLRDQGVSEEVVAELVMTYKANLQMLSIWNLAQFALSSARSTPSPKPPRPPTP